MAIVSVLWSLALLTVVSTSILWSAKLSYGLARTGLDVAAIEATGEAAISRAVLGLLDARPDKRWRSDGIAQTFEFNGIRMRIAIQDELGRIDLNHAGADLLSGLLRSAGMEDRAAAALTDKIVDWREEGGGHRLNGATAEDYRSAHMSNRPRNGAFQSVDELLLVMDMQPELYRRIAPALTVYSGRQFVDPQLAPREVLLALPAMDQSKVDSLVSARAVQQTAALVDPQALRGRAFSIRAEFAEPYAGHVQEATIRLTDDPAHPFWVLSWKTR